MACLKNSNFTCPQKSWKKIRETVFTFELHSAEPLHFDEIFSWKISKTSKLQIFRINGTIFLANGTVFRVNGTIFRVNRTIFQVNGTRMLASLAFSFFCFTLLKILQCWWSPNLFHNLNLFWNLTLLLQINPDLLYYLNLFKKLRKHRNQISQKIALA